MPGIGLAAAGFGIALYLALYQAGTFHSVWDPFFGGGSRKILDSSVASALPVPDASLGAAAYVAEVVLDSAGGSARWRTVPGLVLLFGLVVSAMFAGSLLLVLLQAFAFRAWCTLCLGSAAVSTAVFAVSVHEPLASLKYVKHEIERGRPLARVLVGREEEQHETDDGGPRELSSVGDGKR